MSDCLFPEWSQYLQQMHAPFMANRANVQAFSRKSLMACFPVNNLRIGFSWRSIEKLPAKRKVIAPPPIGHKSKVTDFGKTLWKDMK